MVRSTATITVLSILSLTTRPVRVWRRARSVFSLMALSPLLRALLAQNRQHPRQLPARLAHLRRRLELARGLVQAQHEELLRQVPLLRPQLLDRAVPQLVDRLLHGSRAGSEDRRLAGEEAGLDGKLVGGQSHRLRGDLRLHALQLVQDAPGTHDGDPLFRIPLTLAHAGLERLLGDGLVGEDSRSEEHTSELQSPRNFVCRPPLYKKTSAPATVAPCSSG